MGKIIGDEIFEDVPIIEQESVDGGLKRAKQLLFEGRFTLAREMFKSSLEIDAENSEAKRGLILSELEVSNPEHAARVCAEGILSSKRDAKKRAGAWLSYLDSQAAHGGEDSSLREDAYIEIANAYRAVGNFSAASGYYMALIKINSINAAACWGMLYCSLRCKSDEELIKKPKAKVSANNYFKRAIEYSSDTQYYYYTSIVEKCATHDRAEKPTREKKASQKAPDKDEKMRAKQESKRIKGEIKQLRKYSYKSYSSSSRPRGFLVTEKIMLMFSLLAIISFGAFIVLMVNAAIGNADMDKTVNIFGMELQMMIAIELAIIPTLIFLAIASLMNTVLTIYNIKYMGFVKNFIMFIIAAVFFNIFTLIEFFSAIRRCFSSKAQDINVLERIQALKEELRIVKRNAR